MWQFIKIVCYKYIKGRTQNWPERVGETNIPALMFIDIFKGEAKP